MSEKTALAVGSDAIPSKGTTSPVSYGITAAGGQRVQWSTNDAPLYNLNKSVTMSWRLPNSKSPLLKPSFIFSHPLDRPVTDAGSNTTHVVAGNITCRMDFIIPTLATNAEKTEFYRALVQVLLDDQFISAISTSDFPY